MKPEGLFIYIHLIYMLRGFGGPCKPLPIAKIPIIFGVSSPSASKPKLLARPFTPPSKRLTPAIYPKNI
jgi:hypothetical protein